MTIPAQLTFGAAPATVIVDQVLAALRRIRIHPAAVEADLYEEISAELCAAGIPFEREVRLGPRNRIDYLVAGGIGIEVKKGKPNSRALEAQAERYCRLLPFQEEGVGFLVRNERALLADDMGLGKTVQALAALATAEAFPALVVAPANVQLQWQKQAAAFLDLPTVGQQRFIFEPADRGEQLAHIIRGLKPYALPKAPLYIIHYGLLRGWRDVLPHFGFKAVVFDEIQELRHTGTEKYSVASLLSSKADLVWGLSGTPIYNYGDEIWSVLNIIEYHCLGDRDAFTREWCTGYGTKVVKNPDVLGDYLRREGLMLRRRKADVQDQLPPKRRVVHVVNHDEGLYQAMIREAVDLASRYDQIRGWKERGQAALDIEGAARRATGIAKAPYVAAFVRALLEAGERVLLYAYHHQVHDMLAEALAEFGPVRITGREPRQVKEEGAGPSGLGTAVTLMG